MSSSSALPTTSQLVVGALGADVSEHLHPTHSAADDAPPLPSRPPLLNRIARATVAWARGPEPPIDVDFKPFHPKYQVWPQEYVGKLLKTRIYKYLATFAFFLIWLILFITVVHYSRFADSVNGEKPYQIGCNAEMWYKNNGCGVNGQNCLPFTNSSFAFRCPANCITSGRVLNPRAVGAEMVVYRPYVIGGPEESESGAGDGEDTWGTYRGDSFICPSAVHAGIVSNRFGGCGILTRTGQKTNYPASTRNGITSIPFDARFPLSYTFELDFTSTSCRDLRWHLFGVSIPFTTFLSLVSNSPPVTYAALFTALFFHVALGSDPPFLTNPYAAISAALARFLPASFVAYTLWALILSKPYNTPLLKRTAAIERTIFFLGGLWIGALNNITFEAVIQITRLTARDLNQQPGAKATLAVVCFLLLLCIIGQVHYIRLTGRLPLYLSLYALIGTSLGLLAAIPGTSLRIHHYIIGILLLPGAAAVRTRPSLLYTGILLGLFINGIARWGFAGIVETPYSLLGDGLYYSPVPEFSPPPNVTADNVTVFWPDPATLGINGVGGVSLLVNDVERFRWRNGAGEEHGEITVDREGGEAEKVYLRLGYWTETGVQMDYTRAGVASGATNWTAPEKGWS